VKDLRSRCKVFLVLCGFVAAMGCQLMAAQPHSQPPDGLVAGDSAPSFGTVAVGGRKVVYDTLTNTTSSTISITQATLLGRGFAIRRPTFPLTLAAGQHTTLSILFAPTSAEQTSGTILISSDAPNPSLALQLSAVVVGPGRLVTSPASVGFGSVPIGSNQTAMGTIANSGSTALVIWRATLSGTSFQLGDLNVPFVLAPGQSVPFNVTFSPSISGPATGTITVDAKSVEWETGRRALDPGARTENQDSVIQISGTGAATGQLLSVPNINFGNTQVGATQNQPATLTNSEGSSVTVSQAVATGNGFRISGLNVPLTIAAGQSINFTATFTPQSAGSASGNIAITSSASNPNLNIAVLGTGVTPGALAATPASLSFANVQTGKNQSLAETVTNNGGSSVTITQASPSGAGYSVTGLTLPVTLAPNQSASFSVVFAPLSAGSTPGSVSLISSAATLAIPLSGTGVTPGALAATPASLSFANVQTGKNQSLAETVTNNGGSSVTITQASPSGAGYSVTGLTLPVTLAPNQSASFSVVFAPLSAGSTPGSVSLISNAATLAIPLSGTGVTPGTLTANPPSIAFGNVQVGKVSSQPETLTNTGGSNLTISQANASGSGLSITGLNLPLTLTPEQSVSFSVIYTPASAGSSSGSLSVVSNASNANLTVSLSGTGTSSGQLAITPTSHSFGTVVVGTNQSTSATLSATGSSVTVSGASITTSEFSIGGLTFPLTLAAGQSASFSITFTPQASGAATAIASFTSNASNSPAAASLTGTGSVPPSHQVDLSWNASTSPGITGYNVYRGTTTGGPYSKINSILNAGTAYTDNAISAGQSYYYVTSAVDTSGLESSYSNEVPATIPTP
jgi:hypothetical protein